MKLRLQGQPFQVLALLLERAGDVVTREELQQRLWPSDTFVDFDHSLNTAINKVREALGDSASSPRYVETLARRGYRFIAPVQSDATRSDPMAEAASVAATERQRRLRQPPARYPRKLYPSPVSAASRTRSPHPASGTHSRTLRADPSDVSLLSISRPSFACMQSRASRTRFFPLWGATALAGAVMVTAGVGIPAALLPDLGGWLRLPAPGREIPPDLSLRPGARPVVGRSAVPADGEDRPGRGFCRQRGAALPAIFGAHADPDGVCRISAIAS